MVTKIRDDSNKLCSMAATPPASEGSKRTVSSCRALGPLFIRCNLLQQEQHLQLEIRSLNWILIVVVDTTR